MYGAAMILGGEGAAIEIKSNAGKVFGTIYALFSGIIFLTSATVFVSPTLHRIMHRLHLEDDSDPTNDP